MPHDRDPLLRFAGRDLSDAETSELEDLLNERPGLRAEWERLQKLSTALREHRVDSFSTPIRSRVMAQIREPERSTTTGLAASLQALFVRMELAAFVVIVGLAVHNVVVMDDPYAAASWIESLFGVPGATLETVLLFGAM